MSSTNRRYKQRRTAQLRAEMEGRLANPFGFDETLSPDEQEEIKHLAALIARIHVPAQKPFPEVDLVFTGPVARIATQWWKQGLRVHPELAKVAVVVDEQGAVKNVEVNRG
ncbi:hypothetical protein [Promicromonospora sukumoe]